MPLWTLSLKPVAAARKKKKKKKKKKESLITVTPLKTRAC